ncbi:hypothetical protein D6764_02015 [Candidatus Woesearchaeota archaeon]|nr:MAG: hypothetical protein D6764_02015 [Candidatus Woesearchaeota archaeon]
MPMEEEKKEELLEKEIRQERQNLNDEAYINLLRFMGAMTILTGVGILINNSMRFSIAVYILFAVGLGIVGGAELWAHDDKKNIERIIKLKQEIEEENQGNL